VAVNSSKFKTITFLSATAFGVLGVVVFAVWGRDENNIKEAL